MDKVCVVWYTNTELGKTGIWGIYADPNKAEEVARHIEEDWGWPSWWNEEAVE